MGTEVNIETVKNEKPDVVFLTTGSMPLGNIGGREVGENHTFYAIEVLEGNAEVGPSVVVIGGGSAGCEVAYELADKRRKVTITSMLSKSASVVPEVGFMHIGRCNEKIEDHERFSSFFSYYFYR